MQKPDAHVAAPVVGGSASQEALSLLRECLDAVEWAAREAGHLEGAALCRRIDKFLNTQPEVLGDGGPVYPLHGSHCGMTLRDHFAGLAMQGFCADGALDSETYSTTTAEVASVSYGVADEMLRARAA